MVLLEMGLDIMAFQMVWRQLLGSIHMGSILQGHYLLGISIAMLRTQSWKLSLRYFTHFRFYAIKSISIHCKLPNYAPCFHLFLFLSISIFWLIILFWLSYVLDKYIDLWNVLFLKSHFCQNAKRWYWTWISNPFPVLVWSPIFLPKISLWNMQLQVDWFHLTSVELSKTFWKFFYLEMVCGSYFLVKPFCFTLVWMFVFALLGTPK